MSQSVKDYLMRIGNQPWIFIGRTDAEAEAPILWLPDAKSWLIRKDPDAGKDWRQEEKGTTEDTKKKKKRKKKRKYGPSDQKICKKRLHSQYFSDLWFSDLFSYRWHLIPQSMLSVMFSRQLQHFCSDSHHGSLFHMLRVLMAVRSLWPMKESPRWVASSCSCRCLLGLSLTVVLLRKKANQRAFIPRIALPEILSKGKLSLGN